MTDIAISIQVGHTSKSVNKLILFTTYEYYNFFPCSHMQEFKMLIRQAIDTCHPQNTKAQNSMKFIVTHLVLRIPLCYITTQRSSRLPPKQLYIYINL